MPETEPPQQSSDRRGRVHATKHGLHASRAPSGSSTLVRTRAQSRDQRSGSFRAQRSPFGCAVYHRVMSNDTTPDPTPENPTPQPRKVHADTTAQVAPPGPPRLWRWVVVVALALALIATALASWSLLRPARTTTAPVAEQPSAPPVTDQQIADAKTRACTAYHLVATAVAVQTHADTGNEPRAAAANARVSTIGGGTYLLARLDPATPPLLTAEIRSLADLLQDIALNQMAGLPNEDGAQAARYKDADAAEKRIAELCK